VSLKEAPQISNILLPLRKRRGIDTMGVGVNVMTTIDQLDLSVYNLYAMRTKLVEQVNSQLRLEEASSIPPQTLVLDIYPKLTELDILLGIVPLNTPWAYFFPPKHFNALRRSPFAFYRVVPSMGSFKDQEEDEQNLNDTEAETEDEKEEKEVLKKCFKQIDKLNSWLGFIVGRIGQFLQG
jgi:Family of unknown function (DUF5399)